MSDRDRLLELEFAVIGTLLREPQRIGEAAAALTPEDFSEALTRRMFQALCELHFDGAPIDRATVLHKLGGEYAEAVDEAAKRQTAELGYYCGMLREAAQLAKAQAAALGIVHAETLQQAAAQTEQLNSLLTQRPGRKAYDMQQLLEMFFDGYGKHKNTEFLPWGFAELDKHLYARLGNFIVLGGYPSAGKTMLSIQMALRMAERYRVGYYSFETDALTLAERILAHVSQVPLGKIKQEKATEAEARELAKAAEKISGLPIDWIPCSGISVSTIRAEALNRRHQVIFVDYLQQISSRGMNRYEQVTEISKELATLARAHGIAVIALAQLSRPEKTGKGQTKLARPTMSSFRESGQIEQDADIAFLLYPEDPNDNHSPRLLAVGKNKEGERPLIRLDFDGATQTFTAHLPDKGEQYRNVMKACGAGKVAAQRAMKDQAVFTELENDGEELPF